MFPTNCCWKWNLLVMTYQTQARWVQCHCGWSISVDVIVVINHRRPAAATWLVIMAAQMLLWWGHCSTAWRGHSGGNGGLSIKKHTCHALQKNNLSTLDQLQYFIQLKMVTFINDPKRHIILFRGSYNFFFLDHTSQYLHKLNTYICSYLLPQYEISSKSCFDFEVNW